MRSLIDRLVAARIGRTTNFYRDGNGAAVRRDRVAAYLAARAEAPILLVGEAPGYRGTLVSGIPFTSERQLTGAGPAEATATIVHRVLGQLHASEDVLLWNIVPTHPGTCSSNRAPTRREVAEGRVFADELARGRHVVAVGRVAQAALGGTYVRHPAHGGAVEFAAALHALIPR
jgi:uracil-DNA glycosylase